MTRALILIALVFAAALSLFLIPAIHKHRLEALRDRTAADLAAISNALRVYALRNSDTLPEPGVTNAILAARLAPYLPAGAVSPTAFTNNSFFYVPGRTLASPETDIILYQRPGLDDNGGYVVLLGAHIERLDDPAFTSAISALTLPNGTPWTPHIPGWTPPAQPNR